MDQADFGEALEHLAATLPDLAIILDAQAPDPDVLAEMAHEVIVARHMKSQSVTAELHDQLATLTTVAEELKTENRLDPLTGLSNRRDLDDVLDREFALAREHGFPMSVLFIDLDDFKKINDRYGHKVGDELLIQTARRISACVRDGDLVGRFGGEEFIVVLPGTDAPSSCAAARRLVERFNRRPFELGAELSIVQTASIGVATLDEHVAHASVSELVHAADVALYSAKHAGKNQWQRATPIDVGAVMTDLGRDELSAGSGLATTPSN
jgi:diguanylate cyclase (GGDEF)-like protein